MASAADLKHQQNGAEAQGERQFVSSVGRWMHMHVFQPTHGLLIYVLDVVDVFLFERN